MRSTHKRFGVISGFVLVLVLLAINTVVLRHQLATQVGNQEWFSRSRRVVQELRNTDSLLKDAESGQRGYLYTGKVDYLAPYRLAAAQIDSHLQNLTLKLATTPHSKPRRPIFVFWFIRSSMSWRRRSHSFNQETQREPKRWSCLTMASASWKVFAP